MNSFELKKKDIADKAIAKISQAETAKDVRDYIVEHANLPHSSGKSNLEAVLESFARLAISAYSEQVRSQTAIQYIKFLGKSDDSKQELSSKPLNLQININSVKAETVIEQ
jgi:hypothetical protein